MELLSALHAAAALILGLYALHQGALLLLYFRHRHKIVAQTTVPLEVLPSLLIQLPLFNERFVAERIIDAAAQFDYPSDKLSIQVLDDSTDETTRIAAECIEKWRMCGVDIQLIHRDLRPGYKAGALAEGLALSDAEFVAIFDSDFVPPPELLKQIMGVFADPKIGFAQTRWGHINRDANGATRSQAMTLEIHFTIEQFARNQSGLLMAFNGSGGIWRRSCIEDAGGWQTDTLTEDLDLSYRAQLCGWRGVFLPKLSAPGEIPHNVLAYKRQQSRWARGTVQCIRKLGGRILRSRAITPLQKFGAFMHLTGYAIHPLMLLMTITTPLLVLRTIFGFTDAAVPAWLSLVGFLSLAPICSMITANMARGRSLLEVLRDLPGALLLGVGVAFANSAAMARALIKRESGEFERTPKGPLKRAQTKPAPRYFQKPDWTMWVELGLALYGIVSIISLISLGYFGAAVPVILYTCGFGSVGISQLQPDPDFG